MAEFKLDDFPLHWYGMTGEKETTRQWGAIRGSNRCPVELR